MSLPDRIETPRLLLRRPVPGDAADILRGYARDEDVTRYLLFRPDQSIDDIRRYLARVESGWKGGTTLTWAITLKDDGTLIGMIDMRIETHANVGFVLARPYWNKGFMTEALRAVIDHAIGEEEIFRIWAVCDVENLPSARVMEKAGMEREGILRRWIVLPNRSSKPRDCYCYSIVK